MEQLALSLQDSTLARLIDGSRYIAMIVQAFHLLGLTFLLALALAFNLRLLRFSLRSLPVEPLARALYLPFLGTFIVTVVAGVLLFLPRAASYTEKEPFLWKMGLMLAAAAAQLCLLRRSFAAPAQSELALPFRALSALTLLLWLSTGVAGRTLGFV